MGRLPRHLYFWVLLAILAGGVLGYVDPATAVRLKPLGDGFIALVKMLIGPIIFCTVVLGIAGAGDMKKVGRVGGKALLYFEVVSTVALLIGLVVVNMVRPGAGFNVDPATLDAKAVADYATRASTQSTADFVLSIIPATFLDAFTGSGRPAAGAVRGDPVRLRPDPDGAEGTRRAPVHRGVLAHLLRDDERDDEAGADRRRRRDGVHHRPLWHRLAAAAGDADGQLLPDVRHLHRGRARVDRRADRLQHPAVPRLHQRRAAHGAGHVLVGVRHSYR